jgi:serine phosphatase RsbU (regulator of sigma subunit)
MDPVSVLKASQVLAGAVSFDRLVSDLMRITMENAGADHGFVVLRSSGELTLRARGTVSGDVEVCTLSQRLGGCADQCPVGIIQYVARTQRELLLADAAAEGPFVREPYVVANSVRSVLCLPILNNRHRHGAELVGVLAIENRLVPAAFTPQRVRTLRALASQAAVLLQNADCPAQPHRQALIESELVTARELQRALLPDGLDVPGWDIAAHCEPAEQTSGDWFGLHFHRPWRWLFLTIGDVTGHGLLSSVITTVVARAAEAYYATLGTIERPPEQADALSALAGALNQAVTAAGSRTNRAMTMAMLVVDVDSGRGSYLNAGHPAIYRAYRGQLNWLLEPGTPLGEPVTCWGTVRFQLRPGELLLCFTDGLVENRGPQGVTLKERRLTRILCDARGSAAQVRDDLLRAGRSVWRDRPAEDDCTVVVARWQPSSSDRTHA